MPISEKIGALPFLGWVYDDGPWMAAICMILADFGMIYYLMWMESFHGALRPWKRTLYKTFKWNDTIWIPLIMMMVVFILKDAPKLDGWYTSTYWHVFLLAAGFVISFWMEYDALRNGQYTWDQEFAPSKLWHTFVFGIVFYWLLSALVPVIVVHQPLWAVMVLVVGIGCVFHNMRLDAIFPIPHTAYPEWDWSTWSATTRWE